ncbi:hypothetical protein [Streptomyces aureus]|uniref:Uncharacterized protein n=1 Tax=Streptomyces aureus TaxID=193461 RepID=A0ABV4SZW8_9ACTN
MTEEVGGAAAETFLDGFPIVFDLGQAAWFTCEGISALPTTPFSVLSHAGSPAGPRDTFVRVNNDTSCSLHLGRRPTGAAAGAFLPILDMYQSPPETLAGHAHVPLLKTALPA